MPAQPGRGRAGSTMGRTSDRIIEAATSARRKAASLQPEHDVHDPDGIRLQKLLAQAGYGSRRACEVLIQKARVEVDGHIVTDLGVRVDPAKSSIYVDGLRVQIETDHVYLAFNKPAGVVSAMSDPEGRPCLGDWFVDREERLFHVGRLDVDTEGLIILTNDGDFANRLAHPRYEVPKVYLAEIDGRLERDLGARLRAGVELEDGIAKADSFKVLDAAPGRALVELVLHEGRNRIVRRMFEAVGHPVQRLTRTKIGPVVVGDLRQGRYRALGHAELGTLMASVGL